MMCWQKRPTFKALGLINRAPASIIWVIFVANFSDVSICATLLAAQQLSGSVGWIRY